MTSQSVLVQVKGGARFNAGVRLTREMWRFYLRAPAPVYMAVVPARGDPWIELVDRLAGGIEALEAWEGAGDAKAPERLRPEEGAESWHPRLFVEDALLQSALGTRARRRAVLEWEGAHRGASSYLEDGFLRTLAELAVAESGTYSDVEARVAGYLDDLPGLVDVLEASGDIARSSFGALDLSSMDLAVQLSGSEYLEPGGDLGDDAMRLRRLLEETAGAVNVRQLVLAAHREHYSVDDHLNDRGLGG